MKTHDIHHSTDSWLICIMSHINKTNMNVLK